MQDANGRRLVFGDDGSPGADVAWLWVVNHRWPGWHAEVLTATPPPIPPPEEEVEPVEWESPHPRILVPQSGLASVRHLTAPADPRILLCQPRDADLLVVGTRGLGHVRAVMVGSTAEWLLHHPPTPLAMIRSAGPVRRVVACVDGSSHAQEAVEAFARLPWASETEALVLSVEEGREEDEAGRTRALEALAAGGVEASTRVEHGRPTQAILRVLDEVEPQLVVLGTRGLTGWRRMRLGSTAAAVVRSAPCSALVASSGVGDEEG